MTNVLPSYDAFAAETGTDFTARIEGYELHLTLTEVQRSRSGFSLLFATTDTRQRIDGIAHFEHATLPAMQLYICVVAVPSPTLRYYEAVFG